MGKVQAWRLEVRAHFQAGGSGARRQPSRRPAALGWNSGVSHARKLAVFEHLEGTSEASLGIGDRVNQCVAELGGTNQLRFF